MRSKFLIFLLLSLILVSITFAEEIPYTELHLTIKNQLTDTPIPSQLADITFINLLSSTEESSKIYTSEQGFIEYTLTPGKWRLTLTIDNITTPGVDFFLEQVFNIRDSTEILEKDLYAIPVGSIEGKVVDDSKELVANADLKIRCSTRFDSEEYPTKTDQFGTFNANLVPVGNCRIDAAKSNIAGTSNVDVLYCSDADIYGFQFNVSGVTVLGASGGAAEANGFTTTAGNNTVLGFSFSGTSIPGNMCDILTTLEVEGDASVYLINIFGKKPRNNIPKTGILIAICIVKGAALILSCLGFL